jgi:hypothetical protein
MAFGAEIGVSISLVRVQPNPCGLSAETLALIMIENVIVIIAAVLKAIELVQVVRQPHR